MMLHHVNSECLGTCISTPPHMWNAKLSFLATLQILNLWSIMAFFPNNHLLILTVLYYPDFADTDNQSHQNKVSIETWKTRKKLHSLPSTTTSIIKLHYRLSEVILNFQVTEHHFPRLVIVKTQTLHKRITVQNPFHCN